LVEGKKERRHEAEEAARKLYEEFTANKPTPTATVNKTPQDIPNNPPKSVIVETPLIQYLSTLGRHTANTHNSKAAYKKPHPLLH
jgi:hypothetical protein